MTTVPDCFLPAECFIFCAIYCPARYCFGFKLFLEAWAKSSTFSFLAACDLPSSWKVGYIILIRCEVPLYPVSALSGYGHVH